MHVLSRDRERDVSNVWAGGEIGRELNWAPVGGKSRHFKIYSEMKFWTLEDAIDRAVVRRAHGRVGGFRRRHGDAAAEAAEAAARRARARRGGAKTAKSRDRETASSASPSASPVVFVPLYNQSITILSLSLRLSRPFSVTPRSRGPRGVDESLTSRVMTRRIDPKGNLHACRPRDTMGRVTRRRRDRRRVRRRRESVAPDAFPRFLPSASSSSPNAPRFGSI